MLPFNDFYCELVFFLIVLFNTTIIITIKFYVVSTWTLSILSLSVFLNDYCSLPLRMIQSCVFTLIIFLTYYFSQCLRVFSLHLLLIRCPPSVQSILHCFENYIIYFHSDFVISNNILKLRKNASAWGRKKIPTDPTIISHKSYDNIYTLYLFFSFFSPLFLYPFSFLLRATLVSLSSYYSTCLYFSKIINF